MIDSVCIGMEYHFRMMYKMPNDLINESLKCFMIDSVSIGMEYHFRMMKKCQMTESMNH